MKYWLARVCAGLGCVWGLLGVACSSSDGASGAAAAVPIEQFPQQFSSVLCDAVAPCCMDAALPYLGATCKRNATDEFTRLVTTQSSPNIKYDAAAAGQCLSVFKESFKRCQSASGLSSFLPDSPCSRIFVGTLLLGASCNPTRSECATGYCRPATNATGGVCTAFETDSSGRAEGAPCGFDPINQGATYCQQGLYCASDTQVCTKLTAIGGACNPFDGTCTDGAFCSGGVCTAQRDSGPCNGTENIDACSAASYCDSLSSSFPGQCVKKKPDGYSCTDSQECATGECHSQCGPAPAATTATCGGMF